MAATRKKASFALPDLAPVVLIKGPEKALRSKAKTHLRQLARKVDSELEREELSASKYSLGDLDPLVSPSLFSQSKLIEVNAVESATQEFCADLEAYLQDPQPDIWLMLEHSGGNGGRKVATLVEKANLPIVTCDRVKYPSERQKLVIAEARDAGGSITGEAAGALVEVFGEKLLDLLAATRQLVEDTGPTVTIDDVNAFFQGRAESTVFAVADLVVNKTADRTRALLLLRQAFAAGVRPVEVVGAVAAKLRSLAKVRSGASAAELGMAPWQVEDARRLGARWKDDELAGALMLIARADHDVKGGSRDPEGAVEACLIRIQRLAYAA